MSLFGSTQAKPSLFSTNPNPFGSAQQPVQSPGGFGTTSTSQLQQGGGLFGSTLGSQATQPTGSLFGNATTIPQPQQGAGLFGSSVGTQKSSLFGSNVQTTQPQQAQASSLFSKPSGGLFGSTTNNQQLQPQPQPPPQQQQQQQQQQVAQQQQIAQQQQMPGLFGATGTQQQQLQQPQTQPPQPQQQQQQQLGSVFSQSQSSRIWTQQEPPRQKSIAEQIGLVGQKWDPSSTSSLFQTYLYNTVSPDAAPFFRPSPGEDEEKWEAALRKAPTAGSIPILVRGFQQLGQRIIGQEAHLAVLQGRLHEINNGLADLLRRHDLETAVRAAESRRRHQRLARRCLGLAAKLQMLKNRGYALDAAEEQLRDKLAALEKRANDPALYGREEEIWARMVGLRERAQLLEAELERVGRLNPGGGSEQKQQETTIDEETIKKAKRILEDYDAQLKHLGKELESINKEFDDWEWPRSSRNGAAK